MIVYSIPVFIGNYRNRPYYTTREAEMPIRLFFSRPRLLFQDQDQDFRNFPRPRPSLFGQDQDQDLHTVSGNPKTVTSNARD